MKRTLYRVAAVLLSLVLLAAPASALTVDQALELLEAYYLRDIPAQAYEAEDLDQLFSLLGDPYTYYMTSDQYQSFLASVDGSTDVVGIGVAVQFTNQGILITDVLKGGGALSAGLQSGDLIVAVDGVSCVPADETHRELLVGAAGTPVTVTVLRDGVTRDYTIIRQLVHIPNTDLDILDGHIGYIDCDSFGMDTGALFTQYITQSDGQVDRWLVDLRGNAGGYTNAAVEAAGCFAGPGNYLYLRDRMGGLTYYFYTADDLTDHPLVVLTGSTSASASEALAADMRDAGAGLTVGQRTFGKGVAQIVCDSTTHEDYFDGDALKVTTYRFYSLMGNTTDQIGVIPALLIDEEYAAQVAQALCGSPDLAAEGRLRLELAGQQLYLAPAGLEPEALSAFFAALPPAAKLWLGHGAAEWTETTPAEAAGQLGVTYTSRWFSDVADSPYADEINTLGTYALVVGMDNSGHFAPDQQLTRAQLCVMVSRLLGLTDDGGQIFSDVPDGLWYSQAVNAMARLGLVTGVGGGKFQPNATLTQQELCTILGRTARYLNFAIDSYALSLDEAALPEQSPELAAFAPWARVGAAVLAWSAGEALGVEDGSMLHRDLSGLDPTAPVLREEAAATLCRMLTATGILPD